MVAATGEVAANRIDCREFLKNFAWKAGKLPTEPAKRCGKRRRVHAAREPG